MFTQLKEKYNDNLLQKFANYLGYNNIKQLYIAAAKGQFDVKQLKQFLQSQNPLHFLGFLDIIPILIKIVIKVMKLKKRKIQTKIILDTTQQINYILSECCSPIMGDQLIGYISDPHTLEIHRTTCPVFKEKAAVRR